MTESRGYNLAEVIEGIDPALCSYQEWLEVGMALHAEGYQCSVWEDWSRRDAPRYHDGECERKWRGFGRNPNPVTGGTLVQMAKDQGWEPSYDMGSALSWDDDVYDAEPKRLDPTWVEPVATEEPSDGEWQGFKELVTYLETLFDANEIVGAVTDAWCKEDGRWIPAGKGSYTRTAGEIIEDLQKYGDIDSALGKPHEIGGAWIRFNPLDGNGVRNDNVTEFRYALVESDNMEVERQRGIIEELELPVAALVHSGGKSLHAIVRVDAKDYDEYRKRVDFLYETCQRYGLKVDVQNKNPSRLSRMPGVMRGGRKQWLVATNIGQESWAAWREWIEAVNDDLPDPEGMADVWDDLPDLAPPLIDGVLRQGHKMLIAGPSKAGKSFALIGLCIAIAEGREWLGFGCAQGRVLYVNLELDRASCLHRFKDVYEAFGWEPENVRNIDVWNLRGKAVPMDKLAPKLIRRASKKGYIAVVIDPIYKVITGDENSADQMARFCNQFDKVCTELGCATIYCHHHSKGSQGQKRSMDRASGSGVFARDPDAILDLIELEQPQAMRDQQEDAAVCEACASFMDGVREVEGWRDVIPQDSQVVGKHLLAASKALLAPLEGTGLVSSLLQAVHGARAASKAKTAWRVEGTLREFPSFEPVNLWFSYPVHLVDRSGILSDIAADGTEEAMRQKGSDAAAKKRKKEQSEKLKLMREALDRCARDGVKPTRKNVLERIGEFNGKEVTASNISNWTRESADWSTIRVDPEHKKEGLLIDTAVTDMMEGW